MRAIRPAATGGHEVMKLGEVDEAPLGRGQVRMKVAFAGVNFIDVYFRSGQYPAPLPLPLGREGSGTVVEVGEGVAEWKVGDRVAWADVAGSYADHVVASSDRSVAVREETRLDRAAAVMLQGMTAHYLVKSTFPLRAGQSCLVRAAAGGVGLLLCQMARTIGAEV